MSLNISGLTSHPDRPFTIASSSRDSTVRLWSITPLVQPLEMNIIAGKPWSDFYGTVGRFIIVSKGSTNNWLTHLYFIGCIYQLM